jgi:hypothetical protein
MGIVEKWQETNKDVEESESYEDTKFKDLPEK